MSNNAINNSARYQLKYGAQMISTERNDLTRVEWVFKERLLLHLADLNT